MKRKIAYLYSITIKKNYYEPNSQRWFKFIPWVNLIMDQNEHGIGMHCPCTFIIGPCMQLIKHFGDQSLPITCGLNFNPPLCIQAIYVLFYKTLKVHISWLLHCFWSGTWGIRSNIITLRRHFHSLSKIFNFNETKRRECGANCVFRISSLKV